MAQWEHKEAVWHSSIQYGFDEKTSISQIMLIDGVLVEESWGFRNQDFESRQKYLEKALSFPQWLDYQCLEGWEVFKISRDFNSDGQRTWCVFRRLV